MGEQSRASWTSRVTAFWGGRNIFLLWLGQVLSQAGDSVFMIALMWLMLDLTGSKALTGLAAASAYLPTLLFGLLAGVVVDRFNRRRVMMLADGLRAALVAVIPVVAALGWLTGTSGAWFLGCITFCVACVSTLFAPARDALIPELVRSNRLALANGMMQTSWQLALLLGPLLAGLIIPLSGLISLFPLDALTFLISLACIGLLPAWVGRVGNHDADATESAWANMRDGLRYVWQDPMLRGLAWVTAAYNLVLMGLAFVGTPIFVREVLDNDPQTYAWLQAAYAAGMFPGIWAAQKLSKRIRPGALVLLGIILDGVTYLPFFVISSVKPALIAICIHSSVIPLILVPRTTLVQDRVSPEYRGRVFSILNICIVGFSALSSALVGAVAEWVPAPHLFLIFGLLTTAVGLAGFFERALVFGDPKQREPD